MEGFVDSVTVDHVTGWAQDTANPELPEWLEILDGGELLGKTTGYYRLGRRAAIISRI